MNNFANYALLLCKLFSVKIGECKVFDEYPVCPRRDPCQLGKPLFEMCWFYMGIAQIALEPPPFVKRANVEKKVPQTILVSRYTPRQHGKKCPKQSWQAFTSLQVNYNPPAPLTGNAH